MPNARNGQALSTDRAWCLDVIEHHCIYRSPPGESHLVSQEHGRTAWQYYFPVATLDREFATRIALLFWSRFLANYEQRPFQLAACESGGMPIACAIQHVAYSFRIPVNVFETKKAAKTYGMRNWLEGLVLPDVPTLLVDDVVGGKRTLTTHAKRLEGFGLELLGAFAIASCKLAPPITIDLGNRKLPITVIYGPEEFTTSRAQYLAKYGREPTFAGTMV